MKDPNVYRRNDPTVSIWIIYVSDPWNLIL